MAREVIEARAAARVEVAVARVVVVRVVARGAE